MVSLLFNTDSIIIKVVSSAIQFNSLASNFAFEWPTIVSNLLNLQTSVAAVGSSVRVGVEIYGW